MTFTEEREPSSAEVALADQQFDEAAAALNSPRGAEVRMAFLSRPRAFIDLLVRGFLERACRKKSHGHFGDAIMVLGQPALMELILWLTERNRSPSQKTKAAGYVWIIANRIQGPADLVREYQQLLIAASFCRSRRLRPAYELALSAVREALHPWPGGKEHAPGVRDFFSF